VLLHRSFQDIQFHHQLPGQKYTEKPKKLKKMIKRKPYMIKSILLFIFPALSAGLYSQEKVQNCLEKPPKNGIYVVAHRGAHKGIPENSLAAYQKAIDLGCDFIEIDVRTTKDGKFVSIHNSTVDEYVSGVKAKVSELNLSEVKSLDIGIKYGPQWKNTRIPAFDEVLELCHGRIGIYLDLKAAPVSQLVQVIKRKGMEKDIIWYIPASDSKDIDELNASCPECICMPDPGSADNVKSTADRFNNCILATDMDALSNEFVNIAHSYNIKVITDEKEGSEAEWTRILDWHVDGIQTDRPEELINFLKSRQH
jgi:glycerophosphoryl diester phosphodiesterase